MRWQLHRTLVAVAALYLALIVVAAPARALPLPVEVQAERITVRGQKGMDDLAAQVAKSAPEKLATIAADLPDLPVPGHIEIRLVYSAEDIAAASPRGANPPEWASGVAYPQLGVIVVAKRRGPNIIDVHNVVTHELAHLALGAATDGKAPRWLDEGFAYLHSSDWSTARMQTLTGLAWSGRTIPWWDIDRQFPAEENAANIAYAQSYDFVAFLSRRGRYSDPDDDGNRWPLRHFIAAIAHGKPLNDASVDAYATPFNDLAREWYTDLRERYLTIPASLIGLGVWFLAAVLLIIAYIRRTIQKRRKLALWEQEEAAADAARLL